MSGDAAAVIRIVPIARATDRWNGFRFQHMASDNKRYTRTTTREPHPEVYLSLLRPESINALMVMGDIRQIAVHAGDEPADPTVCAATDAVFLRWTGEPFVADRVLLQKSEDTRLNEVVLFDVRPQVHLPTPRGSRALHIAPLSGAAERRRCLQYIDRHCPDLDRIVMSAAERRQSAGPVALEPNREVFDCTRELLRLDSGSDVARAIWWRIRNVDPRVPTEHLLPGDAFAPAWARLQTAVLAQTRDVTHAWCDRQGADGRFTDNFDDDAELPTQWPFYALITGDERPVRGMDRIADAYWHHPRIKNGYMSRPQDATHSAEYTPVAECPMLFLRYGDPVHVERLMTIAANMPHWMGRSQLGHLHFRSSWVAADGQIDVSNRRNYDEPKCNRIVAPTWCVAHYNDNPTAWDIVVDWSRAWVEDFLAERDGKSARAFPARIYFPEDRFEGSGGSGPVDLIYESYLHTGDEFFLRGDFGSHSVRYGKLTGEWAARDQLDHYVQALRDVLKRISWQKHLYIKGDPSTDRVYLPGGLLHWMPVGGFGSPEEHRLTTRIAASYEGTGLDVAPLVLEDTHDRLVVELYNFADEPRDIGIRVWELRPGEYELTTGPDADGDHRIDRPTKTGQVTVRRYTRIPVRVSSKTPFLVELALETAADVPELLPDLALSLSTTHYDAENQSLRVTVHNIGSAEARDVEVVIEDSRGHGVARRTIAAIEPPLDLKPRRKVLSLALKQEPARVRLAFQGEQIADVNDQIVLRGSGSD